MLRVRVARAARRTSHRALTDAAALRIWLAEHAEVDLPRPVRVLGPLHTRRRRAAPAAAARRRPHACASPGHSTARTPRSRSASRRRAQSRRSSTCRRPTSDWAGRRSPRRASGRAAHVLGAVARQPGRLPRGPRAHARCATSPRPRCGPRCSSTPPGRGLRLADRPRADQPVVRRESRSSRTSADASRWAASSSTRHPAKIVELEPGRKMPWRSATAWSPRWELADSGRQDTAHVRAEWVRRRAPPYAALAGLAQRGGRTAPLPRAEPTGARSGSRSRRPAYRTACSLRTEGG